MVKAFPPLIQFITFQHKDTFDALVSKMFGGQNLIFISTHELFYFLKTWLSTVQCCTVQYSTVQRCTVQYSSSLYSTVQYSTAEHSTVHYITVQYSTVQYNTVQYSTVHTIQLEFPTEFRIANQFVFVANCFLLRLLHKLHEKNICANIKKISSLLNIFNTYTLLFWVFVCLYPIN